ncbi:membrane bound O-acyl transferase family-domain-containing protein [Mariannaea sp. PMI_226]|nr:membrane bound O-acyl transferase family-domain-containing protein [Mariannaea sp. PMI_226]
MESFNGLAALAFIAAEVAFVLVAAVTFILLPRRAIASRLLAVIALAGLTYGLQEQTLRIFINPARRSNIVPLLWIKFLNVAELVAVSCVDKAQLSEGKQLSTTALVWRSASLICNWRRVDTKWEIKDLPKQPCKSDTSFILYNLMRMSVTYIIIDALTSAPPAEKHLLMPEKRTLLNLRDLTTEDIIFRLAGTISFWVMVSLYNFLSYTLAAVLTVFIRLTTSDRWRPLNGPLSSVYTVRKFWGEFWHQCLRRCLTGPADAFVDNILCIPRKTLLSRYSRIFLAFFLSGLVHQAASLAMDVPRTDVGTLNFFMLQPLGIIIEDGVQAATKGLGLPSFVRRLVGYIWVIAFLWWSTPQWFYSMASLDDQGQLLPFPIVKRLLPAQDI